MDSLCLNGKLLKPIQVDKRGWRGRVNFPNSPKLAIAILNKAVCQTTAAEPRSRCLRRETLCEESHWNVNDLSPPT